MERGPWWPCGPCGRKESDTTEQLTLSWINAVIYSLWQIMLYSASYFDTQTRNRKLKISPNNSRLYKRSN